ncbi:MAG: hypothetical protein IJQ99_00425 [Synergistaceae bacterium]|nr:hypothetical protein [Synergistaceae bacterium]
MLILLSMFLSAVPSWSASSWYVKFNEGNKNITYFRDSLGGGTILLTGQRLTRQEFSQTS